MKARDQASIHPYIKGALARARDQANDHFILQASVHLHTKGARAQTNVHLYIKGALARARDQANDHFILQPKFHLQTKGAMELARDRVDVRPHSREDLGWGHSHFSVGDFGH